MMKRILAALLIGITVSVVADEQKMAGLPAPDDIFVIAVEPYSTEVKGYFTPDSLLQALPHFVPSDVRLPVRHIGFWRGSTHCPIIA